MLSKNDKFMRAGELRIQAKKNCSDYLRNGREEGERGNQGGDGGRRGGVAEAG